MLAMRLMILLCSAMVTMNLTCCGEIRADDPIIATGSGTGVFYPSPPGTNDRGYYTTIGATDAFGEATGQGRVETTPVEGNPLAFSWTNYGIGSSKGNGSPKNEVLERTVVKDGTYETRSKGPGTVELIPYNIDGADDPDLPAFDPAIGPFTAEWVGNFEIVKGTGIFKGAKGDIQVTASNDPFFLNQPSWSFSWTYVGTIHLNGK